MRPLLDIFYGGAVCPGLNISIYLKSIHHLRCSIHVCTLHSVFIKTSCAGTLRWAKQKISNSLLGLIPCGGEICLIV